ncbi:MAG: hypothetical protein LBU76_11230 [Azoarcus sp.]|jgi:hypothetical protein|nr:hypothetical protein [Azoarcus sp.]
MEPESLASQTLSAIEKSRLEMLREAASTLLGWKRPIEEIMAITGLSREDIEGLAG